MSRIRCLPACMLACLAAVFICCDGRQALTGDQKDFTPGLLAQSDLLKQFAADHPALAILKYAEADLDNDGKQDLVVIYRVAKEKNRMCVMRYKASHITETNSVPAPVADQMIQFRNIDEKPPMEFILQGRKGAKVGYAIFRIEEGLLIDVFGEGMPDCC